jgi:NADPH:quinone reductase
VLVRGAGGGIGIAAVQLARAAGARIVVAIASTEEKRRAALAEGADAAVASVDELAPDARDFDIVVDPVGGDDAIDALRTLRQHGRYLVIGFAAGGIPQIAFNRLLLRGIDLVGVYLGFRRQAFPDEIPPMWDAVCDLVVSGRISPVIDSVHPLEDVTAALARVDERRVVGKVVLRVAD